ncbi:MAG: helix-turn-helix domain-containing protein, partial [Gloeotrichia echinulata HAB0833]
MTFPSQYFIVIDDDTKCNQVGDFLILLNYQYRAYPDTKQKIQLNNWLRICRYWYNRQLGD